MEWSEYSAFKKTGIVLATCLGLAFIGFLMWYCFWVTKVENYELGFVWDKTTGKIEVLDESGWVIRTPIRFSVHKIDLRPHQITISANQRVLNAKLVRFNPKGLDTFIEWHGRNAGDDEANLLEILKCYAFDAADGKDCPFLEVLQEIAPNQGAKAPKKAEVEEKK